MKVAKRENMNHNKTQIKPAVPISWPIHLPAYTKKPRPDLWAQHKLLNPLNKTETSVQLSANKLRAHV